MEDTALVRLCFPTVQTCDERATAWTRIPAEGTTSPVRSSSRAADEADSYEIIGTSTVDADRFRNRPSSRHPTTQVS